jgi:hypothetical protein
VRTPKLCLGGCERILDRQRRPSTATKALTGVPAGHQVVK